MPLHRVRRAYVSDVLAVQGALPVDLIAQQLTARNRAPIIAADFSIGDKLTDRSLQMFNYIRIFDVNGHQKPPFGKSSVA